MNGLADSLGEGNQCPVIGINPKSLFSAFKKSCLLQFNLFIVLKTTVDIIDTSRKKVFFCLDSCILCNYIAYNEHI